MKWRKKPVIVEADVYRRGMEDGFDPCGSCPGWKWQSGQDDCNNCGMSKPFINTLEGKHYISPGDYIITGVKGERYPCKPVIFLMTYERVDE